MRLKIQLLEWTGQVNNISLTKNICSPIDPLCLPVSVFPVIVVVSKCEVEVKDGE